MKISEVRDTEVGRWVTYSPDFGAPQNGRITSWSPICVFVVYECDGNWDRFKDYTGCATDPADLEFSEEAPTP